MGFEVAAGPPRLSETRDDAWDSHRAEGSRVANPQQISETSDFAPGSGKPADAPPPPEAPASPDDPHIPAGWKRRQPRMTLNGVVA